MIDIHPLGTHVKSVIEVCLHGPLTVSNAVDDGILKSSGIFCVESYPIGLSERQRWIFSDSVSP